MPDPQLEATTEFFNSFLESGQGGGLPPGLVGELTGAGGLAPLLEGILNRVLGQFMQNQAFGGMSYMSNGLFGDRDAALGMQAFLFNQTMNSQMQRGQDMIDASQVQFATQFQQSLFGADAATAEANANSLTLGTLAANFMFNQTYRPDVFNAGVRQMMGYMNTAPTIGMSPDVAARQDAINTGVAGLGAVLTEAYLNRNDDVFNGFRGQDASQVVAELGRIGAFSTIDTSALRNITNLSDLQGVSAGSDADRAIQQARDTIRQATDTVRNLQQLFGGDVVHAVDEMNRLFGGNVLHPGMGDSARQMAVQLRTTGVLTGHTAQQVGMLAERSGQILEQFGEDRFAAPMLASLSAQMMRASVTSSDWAGSPFVNEAKFRDFMVQRAAGASEGGLARAMSGAYALMTGDGGVSAAEAEARLRSLMDRGGIITATDIAQAAGSDVGTIMAAANTEAAMVFRTQNQLAAQAGLNQNMRVINMTRRGMLRGVVREEVLNKIGDGPITQQSLAAAGATTAEIGHAAQLFEDQASAFGVNSFEMSQAITGAYNATQLEQYREAFEAAGIVDDVLGGQGRTRGLAGIAAMIQAMEDPANADRRVTLEQAFQAYVGAGNVSAFQGNRIVGISDALDRYAKSDNAEMRIRGQKAQAAADTIVQQLITGLNERGETLTEEEKAYRRELLAGEGAAGMDALAGFAEKNNLGGRAQMLEELYEITSGREARTFSEESSPSKQASAAQRAILERADAGGLEASDELRDIQTMLSINPEMSMAQAVKALGAERRGQLREFLQAEEAAGTDFSKTDLARALKAGDAGGIVDILSQILDAVLSFKGTGEREGSGVRQGGDRK